MIQTSAPPPSAFAACASPSCASAIVSTIARPSPLPFASVFGPPAEALEGTFQQIGREAAALVEDVQLGDAVAPFGLQRNASAPVAERVVDEVAERLLEPHAIGLDDEWVTGGDRKLPLLELGAWLEARCDRVENIGDVDRLSP